MNQAKKYIDSRGWKYQVMPGITANAFKARYQRADKHGSTGWKGLASVPWRETAEDAQADLDWLAQKKGWQEQEGSTMDNRNILVVRVPCSGGVAELTGIRDYILESLRLGAVAVSEDTTLEMMELPVEGVTLEAAADPSEIPLPVFAPGAVSDARIVLKSATPVQELPNPAQVLENALPKPETVKFPGQGGAEKHEIYCRIRSYREKHGLGCWAAVTKAARSKNVTDDLLRKITIGAASPELSVWRKINAALDKLEGVEQKVPQGPGVDKSEI